MATNEEMVIDVTVNGKKAQVELNKVSKATDNVGDQTKSTASKIKAGWIAIGASVASAVAILSTAVSKASELSKATAGLSDSMKRYVEATSNATGMSQELIAGFVKSGQTAGLAEGTIKKLTEQSIALGRAYPHESAETLNDNLIMLNKTGEAQGFIVDILEQKFGMVDLKAVSLADKLKAVEEASSGVNEKFQATAGAKIDTIFTKANNALTALGATALDTINKWGWLDTVNAGFSKLIRSMKTVEAMELRELNAEYKEQTDLVTELQEKQAEAWSFNKPKYRAEITMAKQRVAMIKAQIDRKTAELELEKTQTDESIALTKKKIEADKKAGEEKKALLDEEKKAIEKTRAFDKSVVNKISSSITNMVMTGKASFGDLTRSIIAMIVQMKIAQAVSGMMSGFSLGGILGFHTGTPEVKHTGGFIGNLPSHHSGSLRQDERIAKLQVGEAVINRAGASRNRDAIAKMNAGQAVGGGAVQQTTAEINFNVQAIDSASFNNYLVGNRQTIENIINRSLSTNGSVRQTIKSVV